MEAIPGYLIDRKLSSGGTAGVYRALDIESGRHVALKILFPKWAKDPHALGLLRREAHLLESLSHPHIVRGVASGHWRGLHWLAMEYVPGETALQRVHRAGPLSPPALLELARQVGSAIHFLNGRGVIHGDIKPANVLLAPAGIAKLCDFGFARYRKGPGLPQSSPAPFGTPAYISPEQADGSPDIDSRADLFSLGATLFHLATDRMPPAVDPLGNPPSTGEGVPASVRLVISRLMAPLRDDRYRSAAALLEDLDRLWRAKRRLSAPGTKVALVPQPARRPSEFHWEFN